MNTFAMTMQYLERAVSTPDFWFVFGPVIVLFLILLLFVTAVWLRSLLRAIHSDRAELASALVERDLALTEKRKAEEWLLEHRDELIRLETTQRNRESLEEEVARLQSAAAELEAGLDVKARDASSIEENVASLKSARDRLSDELRGIESAHSAKLQEVKITEQRIAEVNSALHNAHAERAQVGEVLMKATSQMEALKLEETRLNVRLQEIRALQNDHEEKCRVAEGKLEILRAQQGVLESSVSSLEAFKTELDQADRELRVARVELSLVTDKKSALEAEIREIEGKLEGLKGQQGALEMTVSSLEEKQTELDHIGRELRAERVELSLVSDKKAAIEGEIRELERNGNDIGDRPDAYASLSKTPKSLESASEMRAAESEELALDRLKRSLRQQNFIFSDRLVYAFHTCLKISDQASLTVLAGVSGTGKTLLPIEYARAMGIHRVIVSVQPRWDSPQDLLGFFNFVEKRYEATELAQALVAMDPYNFSGAPKKKEGVLLVLLDEMNLARVEYYFSEFLSKLELRRTVRDSKNAYERAPAEIVVASDDDRGTAKRIWVPPNVLFVGTMNEDESTQSLSDKVLDRANVIRFGPPKRMEHEVKQTSHEEFVPISAETWRTWQKMSMSDTTAETSVREWLVELNEALTRIGRPIGYRVQDAILTYVRNYAGQKWHHAVADQIEYKVLPKLRGADVRDKGFAGVVEVVRRILSSIEDEEFVTELDDAKARAEEAGNFNWSGLRRSE